MAADRRRIYSLRKLGRELAGVARDFRLIAPALIGLPPAVQEKLSLHLDALEPAFRERIMLTVTGVNDCRYCRAVHTGVGRVAGLDAEEIEGILRGDFEAVPEEERPALEFARRWAERDARDDPEQRAWLRERYDASRADQIEMCCRLIRMANLSGNTLDAVLDQLSGGRLGG